MSVSTVPAARMGQHATPTAASGTRARARRRMLASTNESQGHSRQAVASVPRLHFPRELKFMRAPSKINPKYGMAEEEPGWHTPCGEPDHHEGAARRAARGRVVAAAALLAASTLAFAASSGSGSAHARRTGLLSAGGSAGEETLMTRAAARVNTMLTGANPAMALEAADGSRGLAAGGQPVAPPPAVLRASLAGERAKLRAQMLAKYDAAAEIPLRTAVALHMAPRTAAAAAAQPPPAQAPLVAAAAAALVQTVPRTDTPQCPCRGGCPCPAHGHGDNARASAHTSVQETVQQPARLQQLQATTRPGAPLRQAQLQRQTARQAAQAPTPGATVQVPLSVVQQMEQQIAQLSAKVNTLEHHQAPPAPAAPVPSAVALTSPAQAKSAAQARLSGKSSAPVAERAAAAVNAIIAGHTAAGGASERAAAMVNSLISDRLVQNGDAAASGKSRGAAAGARSSAGGFSVKGAYGPALQAGPAVSPQAYAPPGAAAPEQPSQYPQAPPLQYPALPTEAPVPTTSENLAAMQSAPAPSADTIYYPGEQAHMRAQAAMSPQALAQPNLPSSVVQQDPQQLATNAYSPVPGQRPALPDPMPTGYGATSTTGVQDHLFDIYSSKKNAEQYLGGAGGGAGAGGAIMAPTGVAMASASGGTDGDDSGSDPFDDAMFNIIHDCSLGGPGC